MKIALCLFGNVGHKKAMGIRKKEKDHDPLAEAFKPRSSWVNPQLAYNGLRKHIIDPFQTDVFIHSWSVDFEDELLDMYQPKGHEIVKQQQFGSDIKNYGLVGLNMPAWDISDSAAKSYLWLLPSRKNVRNIVNEMKELTFRTESRWWSNQRVIKLKEEYETAHDFEYDFVVVSRLDNIFRRPIPFDKLDPKKFYGGKRTGRVDINHAYFDYWFISGSKAMDQFGLLYDERYRYSIRPTIACREHVTEFLGQDAVSFLFKHDQDYKLARDVNG